MNSTNSTNSTMLRNARTVNNPVVGLLLAAGILARMAQAKYQAAPAAPLPNPWLAVNPAYYSSQLSPYLPAAPAAPAAYPAYPPLPWWYAIEPFGVYSLPSAGHHYHHHHEENDHKEDFHYHDDDHHDHDHGTAESGPGIYESESQIDNQVAASEKPTKKPTKKPSVPTEDIRPVTENIIESQPREQDSATTTLTPPTTDNEAIEEAASNTVANIVTLLQKIEGNFSKFRNDNQQQEVKQRPNNHQLVLEETLQPFHANSITNILHQLNSSSTSNEVSDDKVAEASDMVLVQVEQAPGNSEAEEDDQMVAEAANQQNVRHPRPDNRNKTKNKKTTTTARPSRPNNNNRNQQKNRQKTKKPTRPPPLPRPVLLDSYAYDDEYDYTTPRYRPNNNGRRTTASSTRRKNGGEPAHRRSTLPPIHPPSGYDENYDYDNALVRTVRPSVNNRRRYAATNNRNRVNRIKPTTTTPAYDDNYGDYEDETGNDDENYDEGYADKPAQAQNDYRQQYRDDYDDDLAPRQGQPTTTEDYEDSSIEPATTVVSGTTVTTEATVQSTTSTGITETAITPITPESTTHGGYGYGPGNGNVSFTYGPPQPSGGYGYGPSNGNENISITYGPPTGGQQQQQQQYVAAASAPSQLDNWYNQYAKSNVIKRIQDLLTPNNFYSPQYDSDKYNYNDNTF